MYNRAICTAYSAWGETPEKKRKGITAVTYLTTLAGENVKPIKTVSNGRLKSNEVLDKTPEVFYH